MMYILASTILVHVYKFAERCIYNSSIKFPLSKREDLSSSSTVNFL